MCGVHFGRAKILRLMKKYGCVCTVRKERPESKTNKENLKNNRKPNLLKRRFRLARPNEILLTDVSYLKYSTNKTEYFSCIKDAVTGRIVNHVTSSSNDLNLAKATIDCLDPSENALFHSDQGTLYFNDAFQNKLKELGYEQSMSRRGNCWDNSSQESYLLPTLSCFSVSNRPDGRLRHRCSSIYLRILPLHMEFRRPLLFSS